MRKSSNSVTSQSLRSTVQGHRDSATVDDRRIRVEENFEERDGKLKINWTEMEKDAQGRLVLSWRPAMFSEELKATKKTIANVIKLIYYSV